jgi:7-hydroxymethyl chlorophyll a reductase
VVCRSCVCYSSFLLQCFDYVGQIQNFYVPYSTVDNGTREGLDKFLNAASDSPETVLHYEFMQDYKVLC